MNQLKVFLLTGAAGLAAMTTAQAADLPVKAKAVEYVRICSLYGAGFYYVPGTDTCIRFSGYLRFDVTGHGSTQNVPAYNGSLGANDRFAHDFVTRSRFQFNVDLRTQTQYGVVRVFAQSDWQFDTYAAGGGLNPAALASAGAAGTLNNFTPGNGYVAVEHAFVQFAGFTFGKSISARSVPWNGNLGNNNTSAFLGGPDYVTGVNNIQYTYQWGNGVSTSIGLDEPVVYGRTGLGNISGAVSGLIPAVIAGPALGTTQGPATLGLGTLGNTYGGQSMPDVVGNLKVDQAWGIFTVAGGVHQVRATYYTPGSELTGHPDEKYGYSGTVGLQINNIPTGPGDRFTVDATYAKGNTRQVIATSGASPSFAIFGNGIAGTYQSVGFGYTSDGIYSGTNGVNGTQIRLTEAFGVRAAFIHNWTKEVQSALFGSYSAIRYDNEASGLYCTRFRTTVTPTQAVGVGYTCDPDFNVYQVGFRTGWTPVSGLTFSGEYLYTGLDQKFAGIGVYAAAPSAALSKPAAAYQFKDQDTHSVNFRVQRNF